MSGTLYMGEKTFPFDEDIFISDYQDEPDLVRNVLIESGVMVDDPLITANLGQQGNQFTIPFYNALDAADEQNYDGKTDIELSTISASYQTGYAYGRAHGWYADDFAQDFTTANPMAAIAARMAKFVQTKRNARLTGIAQAVLGITAMKDHTVTKDTLDANTLSDATQEVYGEYKNSVGLAIMHSSVAQAFEDLERVEFLKYTDPNGVTSQLPVYQVNGITVLISDDVPHTAATTGESAKAATYTTFVFAQGAFRHASIPVARPAFTDRDELKRGGTSWLGYRYREAIHPNGFSFTAPKQGGTGPDKNNPVISPTDDQLADKSNWSLAYTDHRAIPFMALVTPGHEA